MSFVNIKLQQNKLNIFKLKYLSLKLFYLILRIIFELTLDIFYKKLKVTKILLKKNLKIRSSYKTYLLILIVIFMLNLVKTNIFLDK